MLESPVTINDIHRLEGKVDLVSEAVQKLVLVEERQTGHTGKIEKLENRVELCEEETRRVDKRIDKWLHLGMGAWTVIILSIEVFKFWVVNK